MAALHKNKPKTKSHCAYQQWLSYRWPVEVVSVWHDWKNFLTQFVIVGLQPNLTSNTQQVIMYMLVQSQSWTKLRSVHVYCVV